MADPNRKPGFFAELKRRNVFRVAAAYGLVGWWLVEVASVLFDAFDAPAWVLQVFIGLVLLGFPVALILAWAFELTPDGLVRDPAARQRARQSTARGLDRLIVAALGLGVAVLLIDRFVWSPSGQRVGQPSALVAGAPGPGASVAVLPFVNMSDDGGSDYFSDGISEEILNRLVRIQALRVPSRTSSFAFRDKALSLRTIAAELGVDHVVEGSVRKAGQRVIISAQLIDATTDSRVWSNSYEATLSVADILDIQSDVAREIAGALQVRIAPGERFADARAPTDDMAAYDHFMLGKYHYRRQLPGDLELAVHNFEAAVTLDPAWADAWDWLAYAYNHAATQLGHMDPVEAYPKARAAALRALAIQPDLATALAILGYLRAVYDWDWAGAEADLRRALELAPHDSGTVWSLAHVLSMLGRHEEAIGLTADLARRNPDKGRYHREVSARQLDAGRAREALATLQLASERGAEPAKIEDATGVAYVLLGDFVTAAQYCERAVAARQREPGAVARLAHVYARIGRADEARALLDELTTRAHTERISPLTFATVQVALGMVDEALTNLEAAAAMRDRGVLSIARDPFFRDLAGEPRFDALVAQFGMPAAEAAWHGPAQPPSPRSGRACCYFGSAVS